MFGSGVPVLATYYPCIGELVQHGRNGWIFRDAAELRAQLGDLLLGYPTGAGASKLEALRSSLEPVGGTKRSADVNASAIESWEVSWNRDMYPVVQSMIKRHREVKERGYNYIFLAVMLQIMLLLICYCGVTVLSWIGVF